ncbi:response regulator [Afipia massiliensis]|uniref:Response regulator n=2 Tax=Afipia massiliensis TaxID=211460 RepID=A0A4U6BWU4_9BRAD|nr:response regulator [Afipia massiliensis]
MTHLVFGQTCCRGFRSLRHLPNLCGPDALPLFMEWEAPMGRAFKHTVLVVEDDQLQRELVSLIFEESDMNVIQCMSGDAAAVVLERAGNELMLMFTDVNLDGDMSGLELASMARERFPHIDVILTSGQSVEHVPDNVLFMQKPWLPLELLRQAEMSRQRHTVH